MIHQFERDEPAVAGGRSPSRKPTAVGRMVLTRESEDAAGRVLQGGLVHRPVHQPIRHEAVAVGVSTNLRVRDLIQPNHPGHGYALDA